MKFILCFLLLFNSLISTKLEYYYLYENYISNNSKNSISCNYNTPNNYNNNTGNCIGICW